MPATASLADRVARQLGVETPAPGGTGPSGATTLNDVLRRAGRAPPAAARLPPPRSVSGAGAKMQPGRRRLETACDAKPLRDACDALAGLGGESPATSKLLVRLCGVALRDFPGLAGGREVVGDVTRPGAVDFVVEGLTRAAAVRGADEADIAPGGDVVRAAGTDSRTGASGEADEAVTLRDGFVVRFPVAPATRPGGPADGSGGRGGGVLTCTERSGSFVLQLEVETASEGDGEAFLDRFRSLCLDPRLALL